MTTVGIGVRALRNIAMARIGYTDEAGRGPKLTSAGNTQWQLGRRLHGLMFPGDILPTRIDMLRQAHVLPGANNLMFLPTGMLSSIQPEVTVFEPTDEDIGRYTQFFDQTITSRAVTMNFTTEGAAWEDIREFMRGLVWEGIGGNASTTSFRHGTAGTRAPVAGFDPKGKIDVLPQNNGIFIQNTDAIGRNDTPFQTWNMMWEEGSQNMVIAPCTFLQNIELSATIRQPVRMTATFAGKDFVNVARQRNTTLPSSNFDEEDYTASNYPVSIGWDDPASSSRRRTGDYGVQTYDTDRYSERRAKQRLLSNNIHVYLRTNGNLARNQRVPRDEDLISTDIMDASITIPTGLIPAWRFGDLGASTILRERRAMTIRLTFINTTQNYALLRQFLSPDRPVQTIWLVFNTANNSQQMIIRANVRLSNMGQFPGDDGQGANTIELNYNSVGQDGTKQIDPYDSDFAIFFTGDRQY